MLRLVHQPFVPRQLSCLSIDQESYFRQIIALPHQARSQHASLDGPVDLYAASDHEVVHRATLSAVPAETTINDTARCG